MVTNITHLLCGNDFDENDIAEATDIYDVPSVTGEWVKASVKLGRLACTKVYHPLPCGLFASLSVAITQLGVSDRKKIYAFVTYHGGQVARNLSSHTTHLICGAATGTAYNKAIEMKLDTMVIVTPDWLFECIKQEKLIEPVQYHPRLLNGIAQNLDSDRSLSSILGMENETNNSQTIVEKTDALRLDPHKTSNNNQMSEPISRDSIKPNKILTSKSSVTSANSLTDDTKSTKKMIGDDLASTLSNKSIALSENSTAAYIDSFASNIMQNANLSNNKTLQRNTSKTNIEQTQDNPIINGSAGQNIDSQPSRTNVGYLRKTNAYLL